MPTPSKTSETKPRPGWISWGAIYLVYTALLLRTVSVSENRPLLPQLLAGELAFIALYTAVLLAPRLPNWLIHLYFAAQSALVWWLISLRPEFDFLILLYLLLCIQAALLFTGLSGWVWVGIFELLSAGSLIYYLGPARGLSLALTTMAAEIIVPAYLSVYRETQAARLNSQGLLNELTQANRQLELYASQVEDLAAMQERHRLARELHDTVSQLIFSITLTARSAQLALEKDPSAVKTQLESLQSMASEALSQLRSLIRELRPPQAS